LREPDHPSARAAPARNGAAKPAAANGSQPSHATRADPPALELSLPLPSAALREFWESPSGRRVLSLITGYFHATIEGLEHIPRRGGALVVSNHALFALDAAVLAALIVRELGRHPRFLADRMLFKIPLLRGLIQSVGALPGEPQAAQTLLRAGELVFVYPGGVDDSLKLSRERYQLKWKARAGFARVAMQAGVPIIPVVGYGIDEMYSVLGHEHWIGRRLFGSARYDLPVAVGAFGTLLPRRAPQHYLVLPPIDASGDPDSKADVQRVRAQVHDAIESRLERERQIRR
jgi:1-acyl-sn-glycerol-3-phosphate acyltransferase